ncbi:MAG: hypothetical protein CM1200mP2_18720 [Planctomycetaceae bacterium]|nr:MAG: hypothetical protein CM1200mP2_18720 [Planctomycetaceae bacterium]
MEPGETRWPHWPRAHSTSPSRPPTRRQRRHPCHLRRIDRRPDSSDRDRHHSLDQRPQPALSGTVDDTAATISVSVDGQTTAATNNGDGTWSLADDTLAALAEGTFDVTVTATDAAGNVGTDATSGELTVDLTTPTVTVTTLLTNDAQPALGGTVDDTAATISVSVDGQTTAATNNGDGTWSLADDTLTALAEGTFDVTVTATDAAGNVGTDATSDELTVDLTTPTVTVTTLLTNDAQPALGGTVDDTAATISVSVDGQTTAATNNGDGTWSLADDTLAALAEGTFDVTVTATDAAGNVGTMPPPAN